MKKEEALALLEQEDILTLGLAADACRRQRFPDDTVTFIVDRNINYTNICTSECRFCAFFRRPGHPEGYVLTHEEVLEKNEYYRRAWADYRAARAIAYSVEGGVQHA